MVSGVSEILSHKYLALQEVLQVIIILNLLAARVFYRQLSLLITYPFIKSHKLLTLGSSLTNLIEIFKIEIRTSNLKGARQGYLTTLIIFTLFFVGYIVASLISVLLGHLAPTVTYIQPDKNFATLMNETIMDYQAANSSIYEILNLELKNRIFEVNYEDRGIWGAMTEGVAISSSIGLISGIVDSQYIARLQFNNASWVETPQILSQLKSRMYNSDRQLIGGNFPSAGVSTRNINCYQFKSSCNASSNTYYSLPKYFEVSYNLSNIMSTTDYLPSNTIVDYAYIDLSGSNYTINGHRTITTVTSNTTTSRLSNGSCNSTDLQGYLKEFLTSYSPKSKSIGVSSIINGITRTDIIDLSDSNNKNNNLNSKVDAILASNALLVSALDIYGNQIDGTSQYLLFSIVSDTNQISTGYFYSPWISAVSEWYIITQNVTNAVVLDTQIPISSKMPQDMQILLTARTLNDTLDTEIPGASSHSAGLSYQEVYLLTSYGQVAHPRIIKTAVNVSKPLWTFVALALASIIALILNRLIIPRSCITTIQSVYEGTSLENQCYVPLLVRDLSNYRFGEAFNEKLQMNHKGLVYVFERPPKPGYPWGASFKSDQKKLN